MENSCEYADTLIDVTGSNYIILWVKLPKHYKTYNFYNI